MVVEAGGAAGLRVRGFHRFTSNRSYQLLGEAEEQRGMKGQWLYEVQVSPRL